MGQAQKKCSFFFYRFRKNNDKNINKTTAAPVVFPSYSYLYQGAVCVALNLNYVSITFGTTVLFKMFKIILALMDLLLQLLIGWQRSRQPFTSHDSIFMLMYFILEIS